MTCLSIVVMIILIEKIRMSKHIVEIAKFL